MRLDVNVIVPLICFRVELLIKLGGLHDTFL